MWTWVLGLGFRVPKGTGSVPWPLSSPECVESEASFLNELPSPEHSLDGCLSCLGQHFFGLDWSLVPGTAVTCKLSLFLSLWIPQLLSSWMGSWKEEGCRLLMNTSSEDGKKVRGSCSNDSLKQSWIVLTTDWAKIGAQNSRSSGISCWLWTPLECRGAQCCDCKLTSAASFLRKIPSPLHCLEKCLLCLRQFSGLDWSLDPRSEVKCKLTFSLSLWIPHLSMGIWKVEMGRLVDSSSNDGEKFCCSADSLEQTCIASATDWEWIVEPMSRALGTSCWPWTPLVCRGAQCWEKLS